MKSVALNVGANDDSITDDADRSHDEEVAGHVLEATRAGEMGRHYENTDAPNHTEEE